MEILKDLDINTEQYDSQAIQLFLRYLAEKTILPELHLVFGNKIIDLLLIFAGSTIQIPSLYQIKQKLCDIDIYTTVEYNQGKIDNAYSNLKKKYNIPRFELERRYNNVREWLNSSALREYIQTDNKIKNS